MNLRSLAIAALSAGALSFSVTTAAQDLQDRQVRDAKRAAAATAQKNAKTGAAARLGASLSVLQNTTSQRAARVDVSRVLARKNPALRTSGGYVSISAYGDDLGALRAAGVPNAQLTQPGHETIAWASVSAQFALSLRLPSPFWVELRGAAEFPLRAGYQFTFENPKQIAYEVPTVSGWGGIATGVRFW